jgi:hypothetical protein
MSMKIFFNSQHYDDPESMPPPVRKSYEELLARLAEDTDKNGVPDVLEGGQSVVKTSLVVNGRTLDSLDELPAPLRGLVGSALKSVAGDLTAPGDRPSGGDRQAIGPGRNDALLQRLDAIQSKFALLLQLLSLFAAGAVIVVGGWMIAHMDAGSRSQGGTAYVSIAMVVGLVWAVGMFLSASRRR